MNKNNDSREPLNEKETRLQAAIKRAEAEVGLVQEIMAREQRERGATAHQTIEQPARAPEATNEPPPHQPPTKLEIPKEFDHILNRIFDEINGSSVSTRRQLLIAIIAVVVGIGALIATVFFAIRSNRMSIEIVGRKVEQSRFVITSPPEGAEVGLGQKVRGNTPYPQLNHYIVVTVVRTGAASVQPAFVTADGAFSGDARFGDKTVGEDDYFKIRVLATMSTLAVGGLAAIPDDAIFSEAVTVSRTLRSPLAITGIVITSPTDLGDVGLEGKISGKSLLPDLKHCIVVIPLRTGTPSVQDQPAAINRRDGAFDGRARFGDAQFGVGEQFVIRVLATQSTPPAGPLANPPGDAVFSNSMTVTRRQ